MHSQESPAYYGEWEDPQGWRVKARWRRLGEEEPENSTQQSYASLGSALHQGRLLSCLRGVLAVEVESSTGEAAASYSRSDNLWRDHLEEVRQWEAYATQLAVACDGLKYEASPNPEERLTTLRALAASGALIYCPSGHRAAEMLVEEGLAHSTEHGYRISRKGLERLKQEGFSQEVAYCRQKQSQSGKGS